MSYVMMIDDDEDFALSTADVLESEGHEVKIELTTRSAIANLTARVPDLVILDVMFPEDAAAGFTLARDIRQVEALKQVPILMLTAVNARFPLGFGVQDLKDDWLPVQDFLEKPIDHDVLVKRVNDMLSKAAAP